jgi:hypothetical protein
MKIGLFKTGTFKCNNLPGCQHHGVTVFNILKSLTNNFIAFQGFSEIERVFVYVHWFITARSAAFRAPSR